MLYLILTIASSMLVSVCMRLSEGKAKNNISMLAMNYAMCTLLSLAFAGSIDLFPRESGLGFALVLGLVSGTMYLGSFMLLQWNIRANGVVLPATFMKLGVIVPIAGGSTDVLSKIYEQMGNPVLNDQYLLYTFFVALALCALLAAAKKQKLTAADIAFGLLVGVPNYFSARFLLLSLSAVPAVVAYPTYSVGTIVLITLVGKACFKERLSRRQIAAMGVILAALVLLNL